ncbi:hypothetical protein H4R18_004990 [Coemansia javaensis]|uniref:Uncharacterized protein n=1 Tax=Coemansia javaensis TaxID=2761396 RepID=A0A9W8HA12_9FUNG|nr:hypothetical protein H4R18_004990 [Coemansia javaensis]
MAKTIAFTLWCSGKGTPCSCEESTPVSSLLQRVAIPAGYEVDNCNSVKYTQSLKVSECMLKSNGVLSLELRKRR